MKKLLGLLALTVAVSGVASADQDVLKDIKVVNEARVYSQDIDKNDTQSNEIGNGGFKKENLTGVKWRKLVSGTLALNDELGLELKFLVRHDNYAERGVTSLGADGKPGKGADGKYTYGKAGIKEAWETNLELGKPVNIGSLETNTVFGWTHESGRTKLKELSQYAVEPSTKGRYFTTGESNVLYFGPTFGISVLGQNISTTLQAVYFATNGGKGADYAYKGKDFVRGKTEGYGINADFATDGKIFEGGAGSLGYYVGLNHHFRDGGGKLKPTTESLVSKEAKSSVYLDYVVGATYTTPSLAGFYGQLNVENEWEKHTVKDGYNNTFSLWTNLGYKVGIDTPIGEISINPYVKYKPLERATEKDHNNKELKENGYRKTTETNELRAGLGIGLTVK